VIVTGCVVGRDGKFGKPLPGVAAAVGTEEKSRVVPLARELLDLGNPRLPVLTQPSSVRGLSVSRMEGRTRAFVKLQDGCALRCSYCIIPTVRGNLRSRDEDEVLSEVRALAENGYREVVLTGVHLGHYGREGDPSSGAWRPEGGRKSRFAALLRAMGKIDGVERIRLSSLESVELRDDVLDALRESEKFLPHFHLPLQSGSDGVLARMNRRYTSGAFLRGLDELWRRWDRPSISTDVIVGFPGETDAEFEETRETCRRAGFSRIHAFSYSDRSGTKAAAMTDKVAPATIKARTRALIEDGDRLARRYAETFVGQTARVLVEAKRDRESGLLHGYTERYVRVLIDGPNELAGRIASVRIDSLDEQASARGSVVQVS
jgi:threonylcarbamoyladenosine tRNA methylthiotransferase MtaB